MRRTKIVATVGPASRHPEMLERLVRAQQDELRAQAARLAELAGQAAK